jgi:hypothetical protein
MVRRILMVVAISAAALAAGVGLAPGATSQPTFAPVDQATVHPGVQVIIGNGQCTSNFVYYEGTELYLGTAAHCAGLGSQTDLNGCTTPTQPAGTPVTIQGATRAGTLAYTSWEAMQKAGETDPLACNFNDFALVRIHPDDHGRVNPTVPHWGGPLGVANPIVPAGVAYRAYGNSGLRQGLTILSPMGGTNAGTYADGWLHQGFTLLPAVPGDSGMSLQTTDGLAAGVLSSIGLFPDTGTLNFTDVGRAMRYARGHGFPGLRLAIGSPFNPHQLPLDL